MAADNQDSVMIVCDDKGQAEPAGWTRFEGDGLIARRTTYSDHAKLDLPGYKSVLVRAYQYNDSGPNPLSTEYSGKDGYAVKHNPQTNRLLVCMNTASGGQAGTTRNAHKESSVGGGIDTEDWPKEQGQTPMEGVVFQDANPNSNKLSAAQALDTEDVTIG